MRRQFAQQAGKEAALCFDCPPSSHHKACAQAKQEIRERVLAHAASSSSKQQAASCKQ
jgi:hypothetical protein